MLAATFLLLSPLGQNLMADSPSDQLADKNDALGTVSGTVTSTDGEPLYGVNVVVKGTTTGTTTDFDGKYSLDVPDDATLVFSYIGFIAQEIAAAGQSTLNVKLEEDAELLDQVVVVGYGTIRKSDLTGSVASIAGKELTSIAVGNPTSALQGKVAGVQVENNGGEPGGAANVFVRGVSSLTNSFPLYVIDGTFADNMNYLNPKDIDRIEVLKDASAAAIYGSRAANGVVIIQTKRGEKNGAPRVSLDIRGGTESPDNMLEFLNGSEFVAHRNQLEINDGTGFVLEDNGVSTDWQDLSLNPGSIQDYGLSVSGGGENSRYFVSGNIFKQDGVLLSSGYERTNFRANTEFQLGRFKVQQSLGLTRSELERNVWFGRDGSSTTPILRENAPENDGGFEAPSTDIHNFAGQNKYGLASLEEHLENDTKLFGNINVSYEITEGLTAKLNFGADLLNRHNFSFRPTFFMSGSDAVDNINDQNDLTEIRTESLLTLFEPTLSYGKDLGEGRLDVVVGLTRQKIDTRSLGVYAQGLPNNDIQVIGAANPTNVGATAGFNNISGLISQFGRVNYSHQGKYLLSATMRRDASSKFAEEYRVGYFPSFSLGWNISSEDFWSSESITKLKLRAGYGELGAQNIPDYAYQSVFNLTSGTSFAGALAPGYAQTSLALDDLQWETAKTTNIGVDVGLWNDKITFSAEYYNKNVEDVLVGVALPSSVGFSEPVIQNIGAISNSGFEFEGLYKGRSGGDFTFDLGVNLSTFNSEITSLPNPIVGPSITEDLARANRFIEGEAPGVYWGYVIEGVYADEAAIAADPNLQNDPERKVIVQPGDFIRKDLDGDGKITGDDQEILGDPTPDFTYGINFSGAYKNFDFGLFFQGVQGNEIYNVTRYYNIFWADDNKLVDVKNAWTPSNTNTDIPRATNKDEAQNGAPSSFFVEDGSYFRLRTLELGYTIGTGNLDWMQNLRVFVTGQNLFTMTDYTGYNPDISSVNGGRSAPPLFFGSPSNLNPLLGRGLDVRAYPNTRSFIFGIQASF
ncbi:MAG: SusC/RagA family TonB-linked outer membrane protein [Chitinophagales bacterium]